MFLRRVSFSQLPFTCFPSHKSATMKRNRTFSLLCALVLIVTGSSSGCQMLSETSWGNSASWNFLTQREKSKPVSVDRIICIWRQGEGKGLDNLPTRGFAGQIFFFSGEQSEPVAVDGDIRIYLFDDQGTQEDQSKPIHQFDFQNRSWNNFLKNTNVGPAYHVFIPYTRKGKHQANCSLRIRYLPRSFEEKGTERSRELQLRSPSPVYSEMVSVALAGSPPKKDSRNKSEANTARATTSHSVKPSQSESLVSLKFPRKRDTTRAEPIQPAWNVHHPLNSPQQSSEGLHSMETGVSGLNHSQRESQTSEPQTKRFRLTARSNPSFNRLSLPEQHPANSVPRNDTSQGSHQITQVAYRQAEPSPRPNPLSDPHQVQISSNVVTASYQEVEADRQAAGSSHLKSHSDSVQTAGFESNSEGATRSPSQSAEQTPQTAEPFPFPSDGWENQ